MRQNGEIEPDNQDFIITRIPIDLTPCTPTPIVTATLTKQLNDVGLTCEYTRGDKLQECIDEVHSQLSAGTMQSFNISQSIDNQLREYAVGNYKEVWYQGSTGKFQGLLTKINNEKNFNYLKTHYTDFPYAVSDDNSITQSESTVEAIKHLFVVCATKAAKTVVQGLDTQTMDSSFTNMLGLNKSDIDDNYSNFGSNTIYLVYGYNNGTRDCDGVGVLNFDWTIDIKNYKEKKSNVKHQTTINISSRSVLYTDEDLLKKHYNNAPY